MALVISGFGLYNT